MRLKKVIFAGIVTLFVASATSVSYGQANQGELCKKMWDNFQAMRAMTGLSAADDSQFGKFSASAKAINADTETSKSKFASDKNYNVLNDEVLYHSSQIDKAASNKDLEEIQVQFRRLTIACRNCHKIYKSELKLVP
ncbi:MAG: cytochrome c [Planctomycetota bacterium]|nr:cytochrome c [Planctomycetota bacterium]MDE1890569.1 cytochrome c [Planctomycetota bacterium]MDE2217601.1 cytochrome c [Planctomycetota bacterium]